MVKVNPILMKVIKNCLVLLTLFTLTSIHSVSSPLKNIEIQKNTISSLKPNKIHLNSCERPVETVNPLNIIVTEIDIIVVEVVISNKIFRKSFSPDIHNPHLLTSLGNHSPPTLLV